MDSPEIRTRQLHWSWQGQALSAWGGRGRQRRVGTATSSIKFDLELREMHPLMKLLATRAHVIVPDWPGFGDQSRPPIACTPETQSSFLDYFVHRDVPALHGTIAAGHAASYALYLAAQKPGSKRYGTDTLRRSASLCWT